LQTLFLDYTYLMKGSIKLSLSTESKVPILDLKDKNSLIKAKNKLQQASLRRCPRRTSMVAKLQE
jgi:hypothetical protein